MGYHNLHLQSPEQLEAAGFSSLAGHYSPKQEDWLLRVVADARRANKDVAFSGDNNSVEVWQRSKH
jgi:hypothetical protein